MGVNKRMILRGRWNSTEEGAIDKIKNDFYFIFHIPNFVPCSPKQSELIFPKSFPAYDGKILSNP